MLNKSDVRYKIGSIVGAQISTFECKNACNTIIRIETNTAEESVHLIETIELFIDNLKYFQAYDIDDFTNGGSIFYIGGGLHLGTSFSMYRTSFENHEIIKTDPL